MTEQQPSPTIKRNRMYTCTAFATRNDGTAGGDVFNLAITVQFVAVALDEPQFQQHADDAFGRIGAWIAEYLDEQNLTHSFDFAPTPERIAVYLARVCEQYAGPLFERVGVAMPGGPGAVVRYR